jgi:C1A family cysteine protease
LEAAKAEVMANGSVTSFIQVFDDFLFYSGGIYNSPGDLINLSGYAVVRVLGWGQEGDKYHPYIIGALSWGTDWGEQGYFRMDPTCCELNSTLMIGHAADPDPDYVYDI